MNIYILFIIDLGFWHEQSRPDRDKYIDIIKENIIPGNKTFKPIEQFKKYNVTDAHHLGAPYDTCSVMHYLDSAFSKVSYS